MDRKQRHEQFVTGLAGGSVWEIYGLTVSCLIGIIAYNYVAKNVTSGAAATIADFLFNWALVMAATTLYSGKLWLLALLLTVTAVIAYISVPKPKKAVKEKKHDKTKVHPVVAYRSFLTTYRSSMMVLTVTAILAVDFPLFPRRFAKTETWGTSLMDLGVGSFVFSMGIISVRRRLKNPNITFITELKQSISQTSKVLALGLVRLASVKRLNYQEHITEYGAHWNFFFTLGLLPFAFTLINRIPFPGGTVGKAASLAFCYELVLKNTGLQEWVLIGPRISLLSENKEGLVSFVGYIAIFMFGYGLGLHLLSLQTGRKAVVTRTAKWAIISQLFYLILTYATLPSRRLANLPYIVWIVSFNSGFISLLATAEYVLGILPSYSYSAVNSHGETIFLLANLATGLINLSIDTLALSDSVATFVILAYLLAMMGCANCLYSTRT